MPCAICRGVALFMALVDDVGGIQSTVPCDFHWEFYFPLIFYLSPFTYRGFIMFVGCFSHAVPNIMMMFLLLFALGSFLISKVVDHASDYVKCV